MAKKALILGSGLMCPPCLEKLLGLGFNTTLGSSIEEELISLQQIYPSLVTCLLDVTSDKTTLRKLVSNSDIVISLLPATLHIEVANICIEEKKNLVTASYLSKEMEQLHEKAVAAGITILVEAGLDPGIDHMIAMKSVDCLNEKGAQITDFVSLCGGIPADECASGPLKYKFSWYPKGMFISALQPAKFLRNGKLYEYENILENPEIVRDIFENQPPLECLPNRDSLVYGDVYNIKTATTLFRGTLRYQGFCEALKVLTKVGLANQTPIPDLTKNESNLTWRQLITVVLGLPRGATQDDINKTLLGRLEGKEQQLKILQDLHLISDVLVPGGETFLDILSSHLASTLTYEHGEEDLVLMWTKVVGKLPCGTTHTIVTSLMERGRPVGGQSAMSKTVGLTTALCADFIATGAVHRKGIVLPITKDIYDPVLDQLSLEGIQVKTMHMET